MGSCAVGMCVSCCRQWWIVLLLLKWLVEAAVLTATSGLAEEVRNTGYGAVIGLEVMFACTQLLVRPFRHRRHHLLDLVLSACLCAVCGVLIYVQVGATPTNALSPFGPSPFIVLVLVTISQVAVAVAHAAAHHLQWRCVVCGR
jgi:hypothetical protein